MGGGESYFNVSNCEGQVRSDGALNERGGGGGREREGQRQRQRQTGRQTDRPIRQTDRERQRDRDRETETGCKSDEVKIVFKVCLLISPTPVEQKRVLRSPSPFKRCTRS